MSDSDSEDEYHLKLVKYDGETDPLNYLLCKFENMAGYFEWEEDERMAQLQNSLVKSAGNVLWDSRSPSSSKELIGMLKIRFGDDSEMKRILPELQKRRKGGASLLRLLEESKPLMAQAYPGVFVTYLSRTNVSKGTVPPQETRNRKSRRDSGRVQLRLGNFDGVSEPVESFLAKFEIYSKYHKLSERDRLFILTMSLKDKAAHVLGWKPFNSSQKLIDWLKCRYGHNEEVERILFNRHLQSMRQKEGESLRSVYQNVKRLIALAYSSQVGGMERFAIETFIMSLNDRDLMMDVTFAEPKTLDEALLLAVWAEAINSSGGLEEPADNSHMIPVERTLPTSPCVGNRGQQVNVKSTQEGSSGPPSSGRRRGRGVGRGQCICYGCGERGHKRRHCPALG